MPTGEISTGTISSVRNSPMPRISAIEQHGDGEPEHEFQSPPQPPSRSRVTTETPAEHLVVQQIGEIVEAREGD